MSSFGNQIQIYQELTIHRPSSFPNLASSEPSHKASPPLLDNIVNDENPIVFNLEVLLVSLLLLALPIIIYLAYRYGKRMGRKEHVSDAHYYFGSNVIKRRSSQNSSSDESYRQYGSMNSKTSSTASSPALNPSSVQQNPIPMKEKNIMRSHSFQKSQREFSMQTEEETIEELNLSEGNNMKSSPLDQKVLNLNKFDNVDDIQNETKSKTLICHLEEKEKSENQDRQIYKQRRSVLLPNNSKISEVSPNGSERKMKSSEIKEPLTHFKLNSEKFILNNNDKDQLNTFENDVDDTKSHKPLLALDLKRHVSMGDVRRPILQGMVARGNSENLKNTNTFLIDSKEESKHEDKTLSEKRIESLVEKYELPDETGKFNKIFKDVEWIGEGSFGEVYKVVHRLDGKLYAVKKVKLKLGRFEELKKESKVFREVFAMTDLHHLNIVRYSTCWVEIEWDKSVHEGKEKVEKSKGYSEAVDLGDISENELLEDHISEMESEHAEFSKNSDMGFEWDVSAGEKEKSKAKEKEKQRTQKTKENLRRKLAEKNGPGVKRKNSSLLIKTLSKSFIEEEFEEQNSRNSSVSKVESLSELSGCKLYLYIQMEYCSGQSLKYYLENTKKQFSREKSLGMFKKLLEGVNAIHSRGILHRDLKPANIFLDGNENIKIGDFGLALLDKFDEQFEGMTPKEFNPKGRKMHSLKVGTPMYTSPEQEAGGHYDQKTDIYSLGLIFYEMLVDFSTNHERYDHFDQIRNAHELSESFKKRFPAESEIILSMTSKSPSERPNAEQLIHEVNKLLEKGK